MSDNILVTGGTGFLGAHLIAQLTQVGHRVRASVRTLSREGEIREALDRAGTDSDVKLELVQAELSADDGWAEAVPRRRIRRVVACGGPGRLPGGV